MSAAGLGALRAVRTGTVSHFDAQRGLGVITSASGEYRFHCTAIVDGTRTIAENSAVFFELRAGVLGAVEATAVSSAAMLGGD